MTLLYQHAHLTGAAFAARPDRTPHLARRRSPGSLDAVTVRRLTERIVRATRRLTFDQAGQLAQLAARTGLVWAARAKLALMLGIGRRTVDRLLADLDGHAFVVVAVRGCGGGSVLIPTWRDGADRAATIAGVLRRAGVADLAPAADLFGRVVERAASVVISATGLPAKALRLLKLALAQIRHAWHREPESQTLNPESSPPPRVKETARADLDSEPDSQPAKDEPKDNADSKGLQDGASGSVPDRLAALAQRLGLGALPSPPVSRAITEARQQMHDPAALRESARRLNAAPVPAPEAPGKPPSGTLSSRNS
jgi:hypothetical protein